MHASDYLEPNMNSRVLKLQRSSSGMEQYPDYSTPAKKMNVSNDSPSHSEPKAGDIQSSMGTNLKSMRKLAKASQVSSATRSQPKLIKFARRQPLKNDQMDLPPSFLIDLQALDHNLNISQGQQLNTGEANNNNSSNLDSDTEWPTIDIRELTRTIQQENSIPTNSLNSNSIYIKLFRQQEESVKTARDIQDELTKLKRQVTEINRIKKNQLRQLTRLGEESRQREERLTVEFNELNQSLKNAQIQLKETKADHEIKREILQMQTEANIQSQLELNKVQFETSVCQLQLTKTLTRCEFLVTKDSLTKDDTLNPNFKQWNYKTSKIGRYDLFLFTACRLYPFYKEFFQQQTPDCLCFHYMFGDKKHQIAPQKRQLTQEYILENISEFKQNLENEIKEAKFGESKVKKEPKCKIFIFCQEQRFKTMVAELLQSLKGLKNQLITVCDVKLEISEPVALEKDWQQTFERMVLRVDYTWLQQEQHLSYQIFYKHHSKVSKKDLELIRTNRKKEQPIFIFYEIPKWNPQENHDSIYDVFRILSKNLAGR